MYYKKCSCQEPQAKMFIRNLQDFERGYTKYGMPDLPVIDLEGVCRTCGIVVRAAEDLSDSPARIIVDGLMHEVRRLRESLESTENYAKEMREKSRGTNVA